MQTITAQKKMQSTDTFLEQLMKSKPDEFADILANKDSVNVQILYTQIDRDKNNKPTFTEYTFHLNKDQYFYPASTVKMPIAFLALEKLHELNKPLLDKQSTMTTEQNSKNEEIIFTDPKNKNAKTTIENYVKQIFLVSDNDAFNRLYEFLGPQYIQQKLKEKGYPDIIIRHRLQVSLSDAQNRMTNPISFYDSERHLIYHQAEQTSNAIYPDRNIKKGNAYYKGEQLVHEPFDFSLKNRVYLQDLHQIQKSVLFPESVDPAKRFNMSKEDRSFVLHWMSAFPKESNIPQYDTANYWDTYCKFLLFGSEKVAVPSNIRIFNKVGDAYGFLTDIAYVIDTEHKIEFMLCANIYCNSDATFNDDKYDYEKVGYPFMKHLGQLIYNYELTRKRKYKPNFNSFMIDYNNNR
jgi:beta-lactamase class A